MGSAHSSNAMMMSAPRFCWIWIELSGGKTAGRSIDMRPERDAVVINFSHFCQGEDLKTARIGQHWFVPLHEVVQSAHFADELVAGTQKEVIGVRKHQRGAEFFKLDGGGNGFDVRQRPNRREDRGVCRTPWGGVVNSPQRAWPSLDVTVNSNMISPALIVLVMGSWRINWQIRWDWREVFCLRTNRCKQNE